MKNLDDVNLKKKIVLATCSSVDKGSINEILKREEARTALANDRITQEINYIETFLREIPNNKAVYGIKEVENAVNNGAVSILLISDRLIKKYREDNNWQVLENIMKLSDSMKAELHIISSQHEGGKKLDGLGGIGAILRYKMSY